MKTWFITGASRGIGLEIARAALEAGDRVVATARTPGRVEEGLSGFGDRLMTLALDVTDPASIQAAVAAAVERFGRIDVLVNNAGYGQLGPFETLSAEAVERQFATNVFGVFSVTREVLPVMRAQRSGRILSVSSIAGLTGFAGSSIYCSSKFAVEGWSEALGQEVARFGIKTTLIEPGRFRTDFLDASSVAYGDLANPDYAEVSAGMRASLEAANHKQAGDPAKLGRVVVALASSDDPPVRFAAGSDAWEVVTNRSEALLTTAKPWRELTLSTDIDD